MPRYQLATHLTDQKQFSLCILNLHKQIEHLLHKYLSVCFVLLTIFSCLHWSFVHAKSNRKWNRTWLSTWSIYVELYMVHSACSDSCAWHLSYAKLALSLSIARLAGGSERRMSEGRQRSMLVLCVCVCVCVLGGTFSKLTLVPHSHAFYDLIAWAG